MEKMIVINPEKCTGCFICELECSFKHSGECRPSASRISVVAWDKVGISTPVTCFQCQDAPCANVCPTGAITRDSNGALAVNNSLCIKCKVCVAACPFGCMKYDTVNHEAIKCNLCGGDPQCVKTCPSKALAYTDPNDAAVIKQENYVAKLRAVEEDAE